METFDSHISEIIVGDTILHNDKIMTVCKKDIKNSEFMGCTLFGDSYHLGYKPIKCVSNYYNNGGSK